MPEPTEQIVIGNHEERPKLLFSLAVGTSQRHGGEWQNDDSFANRALCIRLLLSEMLALWFAPHSPAFLLHVDVNYPFTMHRRLALLTGEL